MRSIWWRIPAATAALLLVNALVALPLASRLPTVPPAPGAVVFAMAIHAGLLTLLALRTSGPRPLRVALLFLIPFAIQANNLLEAYFFSLDIPRTVYPALLAQSLLASALFALILDRIAGAPVAQGDASAAPRPPGAWAWRVAASDVLYVVAYFGAGLLVWPFVQHFYLQRPMPEPGEVVLMQLFRGLVFTGLVFLLARHVSGPRGIRALLAGLTLALVGGVAPLLMPNPYMPDSIRLPHMIEVGVSMLLWGMVAALLLQRAPAARAAQAGVA
jgi:hypothetical protein